MDVSESGIRVRLPDADHDLSGTICLDLDFGVIEGADSIVRIVGQVVWNGRGDSADCGLKIAAIRDGDRGRTWREFVRGHAAVA